MMAQDSIKSVAPIPGTAQSDHLVLQGLEKRYGSTLVVASLDLAVKQGEFIALLGATSVWYSRITPCSRT
jgi:ABC-type transporter Mla maintaining outer membrane lipid asymmetry ATPase subunit MlaF